MCQERCAGGEWGNGCYIEVLPFVILIAALFRLCNLEIGKKIRDRTNCVLKKTFLKFISFCVMAAKRPKQ